MADQATQLNSGANGAENADDHLMHQIVVLQCFDGSWEWCDKLGKVVGCPGEALNPQQSIPDRVWTTALMLAFLQQRLASREEEWMLLANKATKWLRKLGHDIAQIITRAHEPLQN